MKSIFPLSVLEENGYIRIIDKNGRWLAVMAGPELGDDTIDIARFLVRIMNQARK